MNKLSHQHQNFLASPQHSELYKYQKSGEHFENCQLTITVKQPVNIPAFKEYLRKLCLHHDSLRSTFSPHAGREALIQSVAQNPDFDFIFVDLCQQNKPEKEARLEAIMVEERQNTSFKTDSLLRIHLLKISPKDHLLILTLSPLIVDRRSLYLISDAIKGFFEGTDTFSKTVQSTQLSQWQNDILNEDAAQKAMQFFTENIPTQIFPLANEKSPSSKTSNRAVEVFRVNSDLLKNIEKLAESTSTNLEIFLLAAWQIFLWRYTDKSESSVNVLFDFRNQHSELSNFVGIASRYLPFYAPLSKKHSFIDIINTTREHFQRYAEYQNYFSWEKLNSNTSREVPELFQNPISYVFETLPKNNPKGNNKIQWTSLIEDSVPSRLKLLCTYDEDQLDISLHYNQEAFDQNTIRDFCTSFKELLGGIVEDRTASTGNLPLLDKRQQKQLLVSFNDTSSSFSSVDQCFHQLFEEQVQKTPDRIALVLEDEKITYQELNYRANQLARWLRAFEKPPETFVGIYLDRSLEMVIAVLGILKAGFAYVPLDPTYPEDRITHIMNDTKMPLVITHKKYQKHLLKITSQMFILDIHDKKIRNESVKNLSNVTLPTHLAYVIYTSGSTGQPKGVMIEHKSVINFSHAHQQRIYKRFGKKALRASLNAPLAFDGSVERLLLLLHGHTLHILNEDTRHDPHLFIRYSEKHELSVLDVTPSFLSVLFDSGFLKGKASDQTKLILVGGEKMTDALWKKCAGSKTTFYNVYGPTECTINTSVCCIHDHKDHPTIGTPLPNTQIYILDEIMAPVPIGVTGEIYIGGSGLARGYLNQKSLTDEKFLPNPFTKGTRLYKTGDRARYRQDGTIEFIGRLDGQIKLRGFRIEIGEIENTLRTLNTIKEALVILEENSDNIDKRLVAYIVLEDINTSEKDIRQHLQRKLPTYMIPEALVFLDAIPLSPNGKIDYGALPKSTDKKRRTISHTFTAPQSPIEIELAKIWADILKIDQVGIHNNFFELGGHSLMAIKLLAQINETYGTDLALRSIFEAPTIAQYALLLLEEQLQNDDELKAYLTVLEAENAENTSINEIIKHEY